MSSNNSTPSKKVQFGQDQISLFDVQLSLAEKWTSYYTVEEYMRMKDSARRLAKRFKDCGILSIDESLRGLEKFTAADRPKLIKRKRNVIQSVIQIQQMDKAACPLDERTKQIRKTLESYVSKNGAQAAERAKEAAKSDAAVASKIYKDYDHTEQDKAGRHVKASVFRQMSMVASTA